MNEVRCSAEGCGKPIYDLRDAFQKVSGYERHRDQGGHNALHLRHTYPEWICIHCMDKLRKGLATNQASLI